MVSLHPFLLTLVAGIYFQTLKEVDLGIHHDLGSCDAASASCVALRCVKPPILPSSRVVPGRFGKPVLMRGINMQRVPQTIHVYINLM